MDKTTLPMMMKKLKLKFIFSNLVLI